jgi:hypothetical protein
MSKKLFLLANPKGTGNERASFLMKKKRAFVSLAANRRHRHLPHSSVSSLFKDVKHA